MRTVVKHAELLEVKAEYAKDGLGRALQEDWECGHSVILNQVGGFTEENVRSRIGKKRQCLSHDHFENER